ncbi:MAG TPA: hypothetical protein VGC13_28510 [Longimicrobium sp.]|jgi:hypothetical protein|uniref:hypothetical protein n=1 Tax=Longimicrobium sp. TaxID=2029185 RepID=UPI002ED7A91A
MEAAAYGLIGTAIGAIITVLTGLLNNRHQITVRRLELTEQARQGRWEAERKERADRLTQYAGFLASYWQAERMICEILDLIEQQRGPWLDEVNKIIASEPYRAAISSLNEGAAWITILSADAGAEQAARSASRTFDSLIDLIAGALKLAIDNKQFDLEPSRTALKEMQGEIGILSALLRKDLHTAEGVRLLT